MRVTPVINTRQNQSFSGYDIHMHAYDALGEMKSPKRLKAITDFCQHFANTKHVHAVVARPINKIVYGLGVPWIDQGYIYNINMKAVKNDPCGIELSYLEYSLSKDDTGKPQQYTINFETASKMEIREMLEAYKSHTSGNRFEALKMLGDYIEKETNYKQSLDKAEYDLSELHRNSQNTISIFPETYYLWHKESVV